MSKDKPVHLGKKGFPAGTAHYSAYTDDDGDLVLSGQDLGPMVENFWGKTDYEYWITVKSVHLDRFHAELRKKLGREAKVPATKAVRNRQIFAMLREAFANGTFETDGDYRRWLKTRRIPNEFFSY